VGDGCSYGKQSTLDGVKKNGQKESLVWAFSFGFLISRHLGAKVANVSTRTQESTGIDSDTVAVGLSAFLR